MSTYRRTGKPTLRLIHTVQSKTDNALMIAGNELDAGDRELILLALELLEGVIQDEQTTARNNVKHAAMTQMCSRLLIVRAKLGAAEGAR